MKRTIAFLCAALMALSLAGCGLHRPDRAKTMALYQDNEERFREAAASGDFTGLETISGVSDVSVREDYVEISCGGSGFGPETNYYGIFYSETDDLCAVEWIPPSSPQELVPDGAGYRYTEKGGDNESYVEPLGNHFFYYEAHF